MAVVFTETLQKHSLRVREEDGASLFDHLWRNSATGERSTILLYRPLLHSLQDPINHVAAHVILTTITTPKLIIIQVSLFVIEYNSIVRSLRNAAHLPIFVATPIDLTGEERVWHMYVSKFNKINDVM